MIEIRQADQQRNPCLDNRYQLSNGITHVGRFLPLPLIARPNYGERTLYLYREGCDLPEMAISFDEIAGLSTLATSLMEQRLAAYRKKGE